jgi:hypothetical protein
VTPNRPKFWPGCHGVRVADTGFDIGTCSGEPLSDAAVAVGGLPPPTGPELWRIHGEAGIGAARREVDRWLCRHPDGRLIVHASSGPAVGIDATGQQITVEPGDEGLTLQLLTAFAIPMILNGRGALVLHASAVVRNGLAVLVCGEAGAGKSSTLVGLVDAGWQALSEDVCAVDLRGDVPVAWPGPPWVRRAHGEPGPSGAGQRFDGADKTAWDIAPWQEGGAVPVEQVVFLGPPGGDEPERRPLSAPEAVRELAGHTAWLRDPADGPQELFGLAVAFAGQVSTARLRLPRDPAWLDRLRAVLDVRP